MAGYSIINKQNYVSISISYHYITDVTEINIIVIVKVTPSSVAVQSGLWRVIFFIFRASLIADYVLTPLLSVCNAGPQETLEIRGRAISNTRSFEGEGFALSKPGGAIVPRTPIIPMVLLCWDVGRFDISGGQVVIWRALTSGHTQNFPLAQGSAVRNSLFRLGLVC